LGWIGGISVGRREWGSKCVWYEELEGDRGWRSEREEEEEEDIPIR